MTRGFIDRARQESHGASPRTGRRGSFHQQIHPTHGLDRHPRSRGTHPSTTESRTDELLHPAPHPCPGPARLDSSGRHPRGRAVPDRAVPGAAGQPGARAFDPNDPAAFATDLALQIDAAAQSLVDLIEVLARLADGPQLGDAVDAYAVSEELDGRNTTADADRLLLHAANARTLLTQVLVLHHNAPRRGRLTR